MTKAMDSPACQKDPMLKLQLLLPFASNDQSLAASETGFPGLPQH